MSAVEAARPGVWGQIERSLTAAPDDSERGEDLWGHLSSLVDIGEYRPKLADDIEMKEFTQRWGGNYAMLANPRQLLHYRVEPGQIELVRLMDGSRTVKEILVERLKESGDLELSGLADLVKALHFGNFLEHRYTDTDAAVRRAIKPVTSRQEKLQTFARSQTIEWKNVDPVARWGYNHGLKWFFTRAGVFVSIILEVVGFLAFLSVVHSKRFNLTPKSLALGFLLLTFLNYFIIVVHEGGHALVLVHYGRRVKSAGFMIYFGSPALFIESAEALMLEPPQRMLQSFAGPFAESLFAAATALFLWLYPHVAIGDILYRFVVLNYLFLFFNLIPLLELDGYWILADFLRAPELRPTSMSFLRHDLWHKLRTRTKLTRLELGLTLYAVLGIFFTIFMAYLGIFFWGEIFGSLLAKLWHGGLVSRLVLIALVLLVGGPVIRGGIKLLRSLIRRLRAVWRAVQFRLETKWRVEAAQLIDALPLFDDVPEDVLSELAGRVRLRSFAKGQPVVRQGERATAFYVVRQGTLQVLEELEDGSDKVLRILGRGEGFGEVGLAEASLRSATVRALEESQVFEIEKGTFDQLLRDMVHVPQFAPTIQAVSELRELSCFSSLEPDELNELLQHGAWVTYGPGQTVIEQGETGDAFYAIRSGQVEVFENGKMVRTMGPGAYFGEIALLLDIPRTATVRSRTPVRAYRLERDGFDRLVGESFKRGTLNPAISPDRLWQH